jgi:hypothetical protein
MAAPNLKEGPPRTQRKDAKYPEEGRPEPGRWPPDQEDGRHGLRPSLHLTDRPAPGVLPPLPYPAMPPSSVSCQLGHPTISCILGAISDSTFMHFRPFGHARNLPWLPDLAGHGSPLHSFMPGRDLPWLPTLAGLGALVSVHGRKQRTLQQQDPEHPHSLCRTAFLRGQSGLPPGPERPSPESRTDFLQGRADFPRVQNGLPPGQSGLLPAQGQATSVARAAYP